MYEDKKGNDLQELRSRVEHLEAALRSPTCADRSGTGSADVGEKYYSAASFVPGLKPINWQADEPARIPPLLNNLLGVPLGSQIDRAESKSWGVVPEPLIQNVFWSDGRVEEYFRLQNQLVTLTRFIDPTTGRPAAVANYTATVVASGRAKPDPNISTNHMVFNLNLQNAQGGFLYELRTPFAIGCRDNRPFGAGGRFYPDLYDVADRFHFYFSGDIRLVGC
jgi:hypothetical protein